MDFGRHLLEGNDWHPLCHEQDANTDITGDWVNMRDYSRAYVLMRKGGSEDVDNSGLQILQATDNAGTGAKVLTVGRCWYKTGTMTGQGTWTRVDFSTPNDFLGFGATLAGGATYATTVNARAVADVNTNPLWLLVEILNTDLDVANGFKYITGHLEGDNLDNSCLVTMDVFLNKSGYAGAIPLNPLT